MVLSRASRPIKEQYEGESILGGYDVGKYPNHDFIHNHNVEFESRWPLKVIVTGNDEWVDGCMRYRENCNIFSIEIVIDGSREFNPKDKRKYIVKTGEILVIKPGQGYVMTTNEYCRKKIMIIGGYMLPSLLANGGWGNVEVLVPADPEHIIGYFDRVYDASKKKAPGYLNYCSSLAYQMLLKLTDDIIIAGIPPEFSRIICFMEENITGNITMETICTRFGLSRISLFRLFKKYFDCSPTEYLIDKRLMIAKGLLESSHCSIKELAAKLGYANQFFFSNQFKQKFGMSPRDYRNSL